MLLINIYGIVILHIVEYDIKESRKDKKAVCSHQGTSEEKEFYFHTISIEGYFLYGFQRSRDCIII